ncbi:unnamed protein product, partial [Mesorhabditis spiculigera]
MRCLILALTILSPKMVSAAASTPIPLPVGFNWDMLCNGCMKLVKMAEELALQDVEDYLREMIDTVCIPSLVLYPSCTKYFKEHVHQLADLVRAKIGPRQACQAVHMCPQDPTTRKPTLH